jgi:hypothetical protein
MALDTRKVLNRRKLHFDRIEDTLDEVERLNQWEQLHCRHAELHLSFLAPEPAPA